MAARRPPTFDNQIATLEIDGDRVELRIEKTVPSDWRLPKLETSLARELTRSAGAVPAVSRR